MFAMGPSEKSEGEVARTLKDRADCAAYAAMGYWFYKWDWGEAVAFEGLDAWAHASGQMQFYDFVTASLDRWIANSDEAPSRFGPGLCLLTRFEADGDQRYLDFARAIGDRLVSARVKSGVVVLDDPSPNVFVDTLASDPPFLAALARITGDERYAVRGLEIMRGHCMALQTRDDGLFNHFRNNDALTAPGIAWGRGNGWAAMGLVDYIIECEGDAPAEFAERLVKFCKSLKIHQIPLAGWRNLIDTPASYPESSSTTMIAYSLGKAVDAGLIDSSWATMADEAWSSIEHRIDVSGHLLQVSFRPGINTDPSRYEHAPALAGAFPWSQGAYLLGAARRFQADKE